MFKIDNNFNQNVEYSIFVNLFFYKCRYRRTIANRYINVISAPYNDLWGAGKVISISRTIHIKWYRIRNPQ